MASTWAGTADNETVSKNALANAIANGIFEQKAPFTPSVEQTTKGEAAAWVFLNESASPFAGMPNNQLVIKTDLVPLSPPPAVYYSSASPSNACALQLVLTGVIYSGGTGLCSATTIQTDQFVFEIAGATVWISNGAYVREAVINDPNFSGIATFVGGCTSCSVG